MILADCSASIELIGLFKLVNGFNKHLDNGEFHAKISEQVCVLYLVTLKLYLDGLQRCYYVYVTKADR